MKSTNKAGWQEPNGINDILFQIPVRSRFPSLAGGFYCPAKPCNYYKITEILSNPTFMLARSRLLGAAYPRCTKSQFAYLIEL